MRKLKVALALLLLVAFFPVFGEENENSRIKPKALSLLFVPTLDSPISTNSLLRKIILAFSDEMPDVIVISGKNSIEQSDKRMLYDYTIEEGENYLILKKDALTLSAKIIPFVQKKDIDISFLQNPTLYPQRRNNKDAESIVNELTLDDDTTILCLSLAERSPYDLSLWAEPSRNDVKPYWKTIDTICEMGFYDAIENSRQNTSALGPIYSDWTYKTSKDEEFRLDFLLLHHVAVSDIYTMDIPELSDTKNGVRRRALYAHLFTP